jgi:hypothetical protein
MEQFLFSLLAIPALVNDAIKMKSTHATVAFSCTQNILLLWKSTFGAACATPQGRAAF